MAYYITPDLGLELADPLTLQAFETTNVNSNLELLEAGIVADRVRLTAAEAGALRGTRTTYVANTPAALHAIVGAQTGDTAHMVGDNANYYSARFVYLFSKWQLGEVVMIDNNRVRWAAMVTHINVAVNTNIRLIGARGITYLTGEALYYDGSLWQFASPKALIVPSSIGGAGATVDTEGLITLAGVTSLGINGVFTTRWDAYLVTIDITATSVANTITLRLRDAGVDIATATYANRRVFATGAASLATDIIAGTNWNAISIASTEYLVEFIVFAPALARATKERLNAEGWTGNTQNSQDRYVGRNSTASAASGFSVTPSAGTITGTVKVQPYFG